MTAGAIDTPKLLMLSGIGDEADLRSHGIECKHQLKGVGKDLQDHPFVFLMYQQQVEQAIAFGHIRKD